MKKSDKVILIFYACLGISLIITYSYLDSLYERPEIDLQLSTDPIKKISFSNIITTRTLEPMYNAITDIENYPLILPKNVLSVKILNKTDDSIIAEEELYESFIKTKLTVKHSFIPMEKHTIEILDGDAKGTIITQYFKDFPNGFEIKTDVDLELKGVLFPILFLPESSLAHAVDSIMGKFSTYAKYRYDLLDEHRAIDALYREILLRPSDPEGMTFYVEMLKDEKMTIEQIRETLLSSEEYQLLQSIELKSINDLTPESKKIISDLFLEILDRPVGEEGLVYYSTLLEDEILSLDEIRQRLVNSEEYKLIVQLNSTKGK